MTGKLLLISLVVVLLPYNELNIECAEVEDDWFLSSNRTSSTSGTAVTAAPLQMWRRSDMKLLFSSCSSGSKLASVGRLRTINADAVFCCFSSLCFVFVREQIQEPTEEELVCQLHQHPHLHIQWWHQHVFTRSAGTVLRSWGDIAQKHGEDSAACLLVERYWTSRKHFFISWLIFLLSEETYFAFSFTKTASSLLKSLKQHSLG